MKIVYECYLLNIDCKLKVKLCICWRSKQMPLTGLYRSFAPKTKMNTFIFGNETPL